MLSAVFLLNSCSQATHTTSVPLVGIISLREKLPALQEQANKWHPNAYLVDADIPIQTGEEKFWLIAANYQTLSEEHESLLVMLKLDGEISTERIEHKNTVHQTEPIKDEEWPLDSQEVLNVLLDADGLHFLQSNPTQCSSLKLWRDYADPDEPLIWLLALSDCGSSVRYVFLDPVSGETGDYER